MARSYLSARGRTNIEKPYGTRVEAESYARRMIDNWLEPKSRQRTRLEPQAKRMSDGSEENSSEDRFARQDARRYSGWSSALAVAAIVIVLGIVLIVYHVVH
jgi:hypothetical protein